MELFNVGIGELLVILVIMYVLLGPKGMLRAAHWLGQTSRQIMRFFNETWRSITDVPMDIRDLPRTLLDETGLRETFDEIQQDTRAVRADLNKTIGDVNRIGGGTVRPPAAPQEAAAADAAPAAAQQDVAKELPVYADKYGRKAAEEPQPGVEQSAGEEPPKRRRGRPRKGEPRPEPPPPRKRGRPRKVLPEAAAAAHQEGAAAQEFAQAAPPDPPVKERPGEPENKLPRQAPSQPGDAEMPLDQSASTGKRGVPSKNNHPRRADAPPPAEENPDSNG